MSIKYNIGYIDENAGQVKLYRRKFKEYGFNVIGYKIEKGITLKNLMEQVYNSDIDLLMIDYKLNETNVIPFNGEAIESEVYENKPLFPHIIFTNKVDQAEPFVEDWKIIFDKDDVFETKEAITRFITIITKSIEKYKKYINKKKTILADLLTKGEERGLNASEKHILLSTQEELNRLDKSKAREVPKQLISVERLEKLSKTRKEAENFLNDLIKNSKK